MPPRGIKPGQHKPFSIGPISADYEALCLYRAGENEAAIPMIELLYDTMHPALELTALRTGPSIETALRDSGLINGSGRLPIIRNPLLSPAKTRTPRRSWPPGMSKGVARSLYPELI